MDYSIFYLTKYDCDLDDSLIEYSKYRHNHYGFR